MSEAIEIQQLVAHLQGILENLVTRGLRSAGPGERKALATLRGELIRIGAGHLAERIAALDESVGSDAADAPSRLLRAQASLRLFERVLTLEVAHAALSQWKEHEDGSQSE